MGSDVDPATRKRAEKLADQLEAGHTLRPVKGRSHYTLADKWSRRVIGKELLWSDWHIKYGDIKLTESQIETLRKKGFTINIK